jgi:hypothetical protein
LRQHLLKSNKNAIFTTHNSQNQILEICAQLIKEEIINEIKTSGYFAVLADETTDISGKEEMAIAIRYVYNLKIYEKFIGFVQVESTTGFELSETILSTLRSSNLDIKKLRGQGYDGAANMSGPIKGVQSRILAVQPLAFYTHCQGHNLNLVVADSCDVADVRNTIGSV